MLSTLIMAGGQGTRMSRSGAVVPKPLVEVGGVPVIERNLTQLARAGAEHVVVSVAEGARPVRAFVDERLRPVGRVLGIEVEELVERAPLGNIGAAGMLAGRVDDLLVVYADNVTSLDLAGLVHEHRATRPAMTLAAHHELLRMPYGELRVDDDGRLLAYTEKPTLRILVGSAVMVIDRAGLAALPTDRPTGISELAQGLVDAGDEVRVSIHDAPWVDVNDLASVAVAEGVVARHRDAFETWLTGPCERWTLELDLAALDPSAPGDAGRIADAPRCWTRDGAAGPAPGEAGELGVIGTFDAVDPVSGRALRIVARAGAVPGDATAPPDAPDVALVAGRIAGRLAARPLEGPVPSGGRR